MKEKPKYRKYKETESKWKRKEKKNNQRRNNHRKHLIIYFLGDKNFRKSKMLIKSKL